MIKELFVTTLAYRLANMLTPKGLIPTVDDVKRGISLIPSFSYYFAEATINHDGSISWPDGKRGIVGATFEYMEDQTLIALDFMDSLDGEVLRKTAFNICKERMEKDYTLIPDLPGDEVDESLNQLVPWLASQANFYGLQGIKVLRDHGYSLRFNPRTFYTVNDLKQFLDAPLVIIDESSEPSAEPSSNSWDIASIIQNRDLALSTVEYHKALTMQRAASAYYEWLSRFKDGNEILEAEATRTREQAAEFIKNARQSDIASEFTGQKKSA